MRKITDGTMTARQRAAWMRDVPPGCPCDYLWTGMIWTRSDSTPVCDIHCDEPDDLGYREHDFSHLGVQ